MALHGSAVCTARSYCSGGIGTSIGDSRGGSGNRHRTGSYRNQSVACSRWLMAGPPGTGRCVSPMLRAAVGTPLAARVRPGDSNPRPPDYGMLLYVRTKSVDGLLCMRIDRSYRGRTFSATRRLCSAERDTSLILLEISFVASCTDYGHKPQSVDGVGKLRQQFPSTWTTPSTQVIFVSPSLGSGNVSAHLVTVNLSRMDSTGAQQWAKFKSP